MLSTVAEFRPDIIEIRLKVREIRRTVRPRTCPAQKKTLRRIHRVLSLPSGCGRSSPARPAPAGSTFYRFRHIARAARIGDFNGWQFHIGHSTTEKTGVCGHAASIAASIRCRLSSNKHCRTWSRAPRHSRHSSKAALCLRIVSASANETGPDAHTKAPSERNRMPRLRRSSMIRSARPNILTCPAIRLFIGVRKFGRLPAPFGNRLRLSARCAGLTNAARRLPVRPVRPACAGLCGLRRVVAVECRPLHRCPRPA